MKATDNNSPINPLRIFLRYGRGRIHPHWLALRNVKKGRPGRMTCVVLMASPFDLFCSSDQHKNGSLIWKSMGFIALILRQLVDVGEPGYGGILCKFPDISECLCPKWCAIGNENQWRRWKKWKIVEKYFVGNCIYLEIKWNIVVKTLQKREMVISIPYRKMSWSLVRFNWATKLTAGWCVM